MLSTFHFLIASGFLILNTETYILRNFNFPFNRLHTDNSIILLGAKSDQTKSFSGLKFTYPISDSLQKMNITKPTPIQKVSLSPLTAGVSAILHAETGSGKTYAYLLPLIKRLFYTGSLDSTPLQAIIVAPTKELAAQIVADIVSLTDQGNEEHRNIVHLLLSSPHDGFNRIKSPIIVGTPYKLLDTLQATTSQSTALSNLGYLVLDEVDRLIGSVGKYASNDEKRASKSSENPAVTLITRLVEIRNTKKISIQIVAASATVGRPLRRELFRLFNNDPRAPIGNVGENSGIYGNFEILRPIDEEESDRNPSKGNSKSNSRGMERLHSSEDNGEGETDERVVSRKVGIPKLIKHILILHEKDDEDDVHEGVNLTKQSRKSFRPSSWSSNSNYDSNITLKRTNKVSNLPYTARLGLAKELWIKKQARRILVFIPKEEQLSQTMGILRFWSIKAKNLQEVLGIASSRPSISKRPTWLPQFSASASSSSASVSITEALPRSMTTRDVVDRAVANHIGSTGAMSPNLPTDSEIDYSPPSSSETEVLVVPMTGSRGLHVQDVDYVFVLEPPRTMDEYLHMAGRTGRAGKQGTVVTFVNLEELKRMQSWQTPLGIAFDISV